MRGLRLQFDLKRSRKIDKIMSYLMVVAVLILALTVILYMPYKDNEKKIKEQELLLVQQTNYLDRVMLEYNALLGEETNETSDKAYYEDWQNLNIMLGNSRDILLSDDNEENDLDYTTYIDYIVDLNNAVATVNERYEEKGVFANLRSYSFNSANNKLDLLITFEGSHGFIYREMMTEINCLEWVTNVSDDRNTGLGEDLTLEVYYEK